MNHQGIKFGPWTILFAAGLVLLAPPAPVFGQPQAKSVSMSVSQELTKFPLFSDFPASEASSAEIVTPRRFRKDEEPYRAVIDDALTEGPNFAGHYILVQFRRGEGPVGALVVDAGSGSIFRLPYQVVGQGFFLEDACLASYRKWVKSEAEEDNDGSALSFKKESELLIARRCVGAGVEKTYFRWHRSRWKLLRRVGLPPSPPPPTP